MGPIISNNFIISTKSNDLTFLCDKFDVKINASCVKRKEAVL